ncbi:MAG TPA: hypothetical protein VF615_29590 [Longimicrobiaceae bacterium]|jgi:hypothetical protein
MSSRPVRSEETPAPAAQQPAPRTEQLIATHKAWITVAAGLESRHARRRPRYLRPLAISTGIVAAAMLLASLTLGAGGESTGRPADLAGELIPTLGADHPAPRPTRQAARAFRGTEVGNAAKKRPATRNAKRSEPDAARGDRAAARSKAEPPAEPRVPEPSLALTTVPTTAPQVTDGRPATEPDAAGARSADAQPPRTAAAVPAVQ